MSLLLLIDCSFSTNEACFSLRLSQAPNNVVNYRGVSTQLALEYFLVNPVTGDISVRSVRLATDDNTLYQVSISLHA